MLSKRDKFTTRSQACIFIGYSFGIKAFKVLNLESNKIASSRDVVFHEAVFPFASKASSNDIIELFPHVVLPLLVIDFTCC